MHRFFTARSRAAVASSVLPLVSAPRRAYTPLDASDVQRDVAPCIDIVEVSDDPAHGSMVRMVYHSRSVEFMHYPQMGPRKTDPMDPMPQFDFQNRIFFRAGRKSIAEMLAVVEGKQSEMNYQSPYGASVNFGKIPEGFLMKLSSPDYKNKTEVRSCEISYKGHHAASLKHFLSGALCKGFGFEDMSSSEALAVVLASGNAQRNNYNNRRNRSRQGGKEGTEGGSKANEAPARKSFDQVGPGMDSASAPVKPKTVDDLDDW
eukprot:CAMPEP_0201475156 /NCGR_PEP_ID=MMETSP0151_2-20130828/604_1 /ASSEMBLY_ACC=CAM_ASM_000257 /TAXON_ID=200890 /ORGANISM="Paramoeba atlantica, Strain 621/1 / CCAP 1560/9" /LENGTH=260 /DNA_ID=CAMNT_0047855173 /DNA_START=65 /DNA_END=847 /DNA_ORIENTATION=-